ncbi:MAG: hypothetical protein SV422_12775 [Pseudomonadota bacterium]|nr:hypothetical protein [Pseudomonadota bacterium]
MSHTGMAEWFAELAVWSAGVVDWFVALPGFTQIFFGLFLFMMAIPIATLTVFQFVESLRGLRELSKEKKRRKHGDED